MSNENLTETLHYCISASIPCVAISTSETEEVVRRVTEYAAKSSHKLRGRGVPRKVFVWRESVGFEEYAVFTNKDGKKIRLDKITHQTANYDIRPVTQTNHEGRNVSVVYGPEDDFPGATIPFAVEFMQNYDPNEEGCGAIFILRDWHRYIEPNNNGDHVDRQLALFEDLRQGREKSVIILSPERWSAENIPLELNQMIKQAKLDLPEKNERLRIITQMYQSIVASRSQDFDVSELNERILEDISDATAGLTRSQIEDVLSLSLVSRKTMDVDYILNEKRKLVEQAGFIMTRPLTGFEKIGGLTPLKRWAERLRKRFTKAARDFGFPRYPRGLLMAGVPGCGKSAISKAIANEWNMNLLTVQATDLKGSLVGESEAKVHRLLDTARAAAPIIVFVDEAEKLLGKSEGIHDGGAHDAVLGQFLSFMQEDESGVFFVFTANNMEKFAPELVDRFEGRFFIDLPTASEREEILKIHLGLRKQEAESFDLKALVSATKDFSGRNIEDSIEEAMSIAFNDERALSQNDMIETFAMVVPTSKTKKTEIETMRSYVENGLMRKANEIPQAAIDEESDGNVRDFI